MSSPRDTDVGELLRQLSGAGVEFIVVEGAAAVLHGAPITTEDLDIVHRRSPENVSRLKALLDGLDAYVRELANRRLPPQESALLGAVTVPWGATADRNLSPERCMDRRRTRSFRSSLHDNNATFRAHSPKVVAPGCDAKSTSSSSLGHIGKTIESTPQRF